MGSGRSFTLFLLALTVSDTSFAATVTVPGDTATINGALELLDYNDGVADLVLIGPGIYDEQVAPKGNAGVDSVAFPTDPDITTDLVRQAVGSHTDPLTMRGNDPNNPPVFRIEEMAPAQYTFNPSDNQFSPTIVLCGKDVTLENINLQFSPTGIQTAMYGMASDMVWRDCVFSNGATIAGGADFGEYGNNFNFLSSNDPLIGLDNEYLYTNCIIDGSSVVNGQPLGVWAYFHGYDASTPAGAAVGSGVTLDNCVGRHWLGILHYFRSISLGGTSGAPNGLHVSDCYFESAGDTVFQMDGSFADTEIVRCVFNSGDIPGRLLTANTRVSAPNRRGWISNILFANNLVVGSGNTIPITIDHSDQINVGSTPSLHLVNNTFYDTFIECILLTGAETDVATINISNNIFTGKDDNEGDAVTVAPSNPEAIVGNISNNLFFRRPGSDIFNSSNAVVSGNLTGDPTFNGVTVNIPAVPPTDVGSRLQQFVPAALAIDAGSDALYAAAGPLAGDLDVDSLNPRISGGAIDIGAQEFAIDTPTPTPTDTQPPTLTFTPTSTPTETLEPTQTLISTATSTSTFAPSATSTPSPSNTPEITPSPSFTITATNTPTATESPTNTLPTPTPSSTDTPTQTVSPTPGPTLSKGELLFNFSLIWGELVNEEDFNAVDLLELIGQITD